MTACVRGCRVKRRHLAACDGDCAGCEPRQADYGTLCWPCHRQLERMLVDAPVVDAWMSANLAPIRSAQTRQDWERATKDFGSPAPLKVDILDQRDLLRDQLASWADELIAEKSLRHTEPHSVVNDADLLRRFLEHVESTTWVGDLIEELRDTLGVCNALAPWKPEAKRESSVPCPDCGETQLVVFGGSTDRKCLSCRFVLTEQQFHRWRFVVLSEAEAQAKEAS